jgi:hypothetical protein
MRAGEWIKLFGEQIYVIAAREQTVEWLAGFRVAALQYVVVGQPETTRQKGSLTQREPMDCRFRSAEQIRC